MSPLIQLVGGALAKKASPKVTEKVLPKDTKKLSENKNIIKKHIDNNPDNTDNNGLKSAPESVAGKIPEIKKSIAKNKKMGLQLSSNNKPVLSKLAKVIQVTKENLDVNKKSLTVQKHTAEWNKETAYKAAHALKEKVKNAASKGVTKVKGMAGTALQKTKSVVDSQGGFLKTIGKLLAAGYLIKKLWPTFSRLVPKILDEYVMPFLKNTLWPLIKENWKSLLAGAGILTFLANPLGFMKTAVKAAFKVGGGLFKIFTSLIKKAFSLGSPILKTIKNKVVDIAKSGFQKAKSLAGLAKDKLFKSGKPLLKKTGGVVSKVVSGAGTGLKKIAGAGLKGFAGLLKVLKPLAKLIPFIGPVLMALDLIDTLFPNLKYAIMEFFSPKKIVAFAKTIWKKVVDTVGTITEWVSNKFAGIINLIRGGLANLISSTYGKIPVIGKYANQMADFIRGKPTDLDKEAKYVATDYDEQRGKKAQAKLEKKGAIEHNKFSKDDIKDWGAIENLPANTIKGLIASGNFSDKDEARMKSIIDKKLAKSEKAKKDSAEKSKPKGQLDKEQQQKDSAALVNVTKSIQNFEKLIKMGKEKGINTRAYSKALAIQKAKQKALQEKLKTPIKSNAISNARSNTGISTGISTDTPEKTNSITKPSGETNTLVPVKVKASIPSKPSKPSKTSDKVPQKIGDIKETEVFKGKKLKNMNKDVETNLKGLGYEYKEKFGEKLQLNSTGRSVKEQQKLYNEMLKRNKGVSDGSVATPGGSMHNYGLAVDAQSKQLQKAESSGLMAKYGFHRPVHKANGALETWHMEAMGIDRNAVRLQGKKAIKDGKDVDTLSKEGAFTKGQIKPLDADGNTLGSAKKEAKIVKNKKENSNSKWDLNTAAGKAAYEKEQSGHKLSLAEDIESSSISSMQSILGDMGIGENGIAGMGEAAQIYNKKPINFLKGKQDSKQEKSNKNSKKSSEDNISLLKLEKQFPMIPKNIKLIKSELGWDLNTAAGLAGFKEEQQKAAAQNLDITTKEGIKNWKKLTDENKDLGMDTLDTLGRQSIQTMQSILGDMGIGENGIAGMGEASEATNGFKNVFLGKNKTLQPKKDLMPKNKLSINHLRASNIELKSNNNSGESIKNKNVQTSQKREKSLEIDNKTKLMAKQSAPIIKAPDPVLVEHTNTVIHKEPSEAPKITLHDAEMEAGSFMLMGSVI